MRLDEIYRVVCAEIVRSTDFVSELMSTRFDGQRTARCVVDRCYSLVPLIWIGVYNMAHRINLFSSPCELLKRVIFHLAHTALTGTAEHGGASRDVVDRCLCLMPFGVCVAHVVFTM